MILKSIVIGSHAFYYYDAPDTIVDYIKQGELHGANNYFLIDKYRKNSGWIIDVGANLGTFGFAPAINNKKVLMIECAEKNYECLELTFKNLENVILSSDIVSDREHFCLFNSDYGSGGTISDNIHGDKKTTTIDNLCEKNNIDNVAIIKYDIEGYEGEALLGSQKILEKTHAVLLVEINGHCLNLREKKPSYVLDIIEQLGYISFFAYNDKILIPINKNDNFPFCVVDLVCIHKDNLYQYIQDLTFREKLSKNEISQILASNRENSNDDCKRYFETIEP